MGQGVPDGKYPFLVALGRADRSGDFLWRNQFCGGSLIAPSYVLTAAHCVAGNSPSQLTIVVGRTDLTTSTGEVRDVAAITVHPGYNPRTIGHDVAVLQLAEPVESVAPIALVETGDPSLQEAGDGVTLTGWGDTLRGPHLGRPGVFRSRLQERAVAVVGDGACNRQWRKAGYRRGIAQELVVCTSSRKAGHGDSGSPVFASVEGSYVQVGIVSGGTAALGKIVPLTLIPRSTHPRSPSFIADGNRVGDESEAGDRRRGDRQLRGYLTGSSTFHDSTRLTDSTSAGCFLASRALPRLALTMRWTSASSSAAQPRRRANPSSGSAATNTLSAYSSAWRRMRKPSLLRTARSTPQTLAIT